MGQKLVACVARYALLASSRESGRANATAMLASMNVLSGKLSFSGASRKSRTCKTYTEHSTSRRDAL